MLLRSAVCNWSVVANAQSLYQISTSIGSKIFINSPVADIMLSAPRPVMRSFSSLGSLRSSVRAQAVTSGDTDATAVPTAAASTRKMRTLSSKKSAAAKAPLGSGDAQVTPVAEPQPGMSAADAEEAARKVFNSANRMFGSG